MLETNMSSELHTARETEKEETTGENNKKALASSSARSDTTSTILMPKKRPEQQQKDNIVLTQLARQLEYYFSQQNLSKDTYLQTLRTLNDGCVPATILSEFGKVKAIVSPAKQRLEAVLRAASEFSDLLQVFSIDTLTGKIVDTTNEKEADEEKHANTILAIGPISNEPLPVLSSTIPLPSSPFCNTMILRDVDPIVTEEEVRAAFATIDSCPPIESIHLDVANCWFVSLDTSSRETMIRVMMQLQTQTLAGAPIHARLKARQPSSLVVDTTVWMEPTRKKKKKKRCKKKKKDASSSAIAPAPLSMGEDNFPTLQDKKVEWETSPDDVDKDGKHGLDDDPKSLKSDAASTATTTSSSVESMMPPKKTLPAGGYAAALLKTAPVIREPGVVNKEQVAAEKHVATSEPPAEATTMMATEEEQTPSMVITPPSWGGGRSFADVIKKETT